MTEKHKITLEIPDEIYAGIMAFGKNNKINDSCTAVVELIKHALKFPPYFKDFDWIMAEEEADDEIRSGDVMEFSRNDYEKLASKLGQLKKGRSTRHKGSASVRKHLKNLMK